MDFQLEEATVSLPAPEGAEFREPDGLDAGTRHLVWTAAPGAFFMVSAGTSAGHTPAGVEGEIDSDEPVPLAGDGARRIAYRTTRERPRELRPEGSVPARTERLLSDLLFVPGERQHLRIGYRVPQDAPEELRARLAGMLDRVQVRRHDGA